MHWLNKAICSAAVAPAASYHTQQLLLLLLLRPTWLTAVVSSFSLGPSTHTCRAEPHLFYEVDVQTQGSETGSACGAAAHANVSYVSSCIDG
jgi:hypothetical protein